MTFTPTQEKIQEYLNKNLSTWANEDDLKALEKIVLEGIDWKELRNRFFNECTIKDNSEEIVKIKIDICPHNLFEWFHIAILEGKK